MTGDGISDCERLFAILEDELGKNRGAYLLGESSLPDLALTPTVIRLDAPSPDFED
jgi:glutathione S-transferase